MHLKASKKIRAEIKGLQLNVIIEKGETIRTEISAKFKRESAEQMASGAGMKIERWFTDAKNWFSLAEMSLIT